MKNEIDIATFSHKGNKPNQEDCICYGSVCVSEPLYYVVVCDGLGGHSNGEIASSLVCESFSRSIENVENEVKYLITLKKENECLEFEYTTQVQK